MAAGSYVAEEQEALLEDALGFAAEQRFYLRKAINQKDLHMALRSAVCLANELRSSQLMPESYYKLYALVAWELQHLAVFLSEVLQQDPTMATELYELAQCEGNVLPRLYVLVTVGAVYAQADPDQASETLDDLASMLAAVQHPVRGLFLRYYFLQCAKDKFFRLGTETSVKYLLLNLRESISLWARLRLLDSAAITDAGAEELGAGWQLDRSRHTLRFLIGAHLMHLARLRELSVGVYVETVLPEVLRLSTTCEDAAGQAYLLQSFVEAFPDGLHLHTLERVLAACLQVHWIVDLRPLLQHLLRRLTAHVKGISADEAADAVDVFSLFHSHVQQLHARPRSRATPLTSLLGLQLELIMASISLHPGDPGRVELVLAGTAELLQQRQELLSQRSEEVLLDILAAPLTQESLAPAVLAMPYHATMMACMQGGAQRSAAFTMVTAVLSGGVRFNDCETLRRMLSLLDRLIRDEGESSCAEGLGAQKHLEHDPVTFTTEQEKMARLVHQVQHTEPVEAFRMLVELRTHFEDGGPHRQRFTLPAVAVATLRLARPLFATAQSVGDTNSRSLGLQEFFDFVHRTILMIDELDPMESLRLWLLSAASTDALDESAEGPADACHVRVREVSNRFICGALTCLESRLRDAKDQLLALQLVTGTLRQIRGLEVTHYRLASERAVRFAGCLNSKALQCKGLSLCAGLFYGTAHGDPGQAVACLQGALRCADGAIHVDPLDVSLFIGVLDRAAGIFDEVDSRVSAPFVSCLLALCVHHLQYIGIRVPAESRNALRAAVLDLQAKQKKAAASAESSADSAARSELVAGAARYADLRLDIALDAPGLMKPLSAKA